ncbi:MAG TPA: HNH endonuclease signature motif containing protein, partial [Amycolatopsis sp.]|nr:HNH endonuclease signature motif containing protein [Amycolatopsis sp.]
ATRAQRRALTLRDLGCSAPGCTRTPKWTSVHHVRWWSRGGTTDLDNLTLVCATHHRLIHQAGWQVTIRDNQAWWTLPEWLDPEQTPRRNTAHTTGPPPHHHHHTDTPHQSDVPENTTPPTFASPPPRTSAADHAEHHNTT